MRALPARHLPRPWRNALGAKIGCASEVSARPMATPEALSNQDEQQRICDRCCFGRIIHEKQRPSLLAAEPSLSVRQEPARSFERLSVRLYSRRRRPYGSIASVASGERVAAGAPDQAIVWNAVRIDRVLDDQRDGARDVSADKRAGEDRWAWIPGIGIQH
jgi:hypothetical protein